MASRSLRLGLAEEQRDVLVVVARWCLDPRSSLFWQNPWLQQLGDLTSTGDSVTVHRA
jgi:hypothetical protein